MRNLVNRYELEAEFFKSLHEICDPLGLAVTSTRIRADLTLGKLHGHTCHISPIGCQYRQLRYCVRAPHPVTYRKLKY